MTFDDACGSMENCDREGRRTCWVIKETRRVSRKKLVVGLLIVFTAAVLLLWYGNAVQVVAPDKNLLERAKTAILTNDTKALAVVSGEIQKVSGYDRSPDYLSVVTYSQLTSADSVNAEISLKKLKKLLPFTYSSNLPWKNTDEVVASFEHELQFLKQYDESVKNHHFSESGGEK